MQGESAQPARGERGEEVDCGRAVLDGGGMFVCAKKAAIAAVDGRAQDAVRCG
jgi:hypothetical protein